MAEQPHIFQIAELVITDGRDVLLHSIETAPGKEVWDIFSTEVRDSSYRDALQQAFPFASIAAAEFAGQVHKADKYERTGELALARRAFLYYTLKICQL